MFSSSSSSSGDNNWETCKENVLPVKSGRVVTHLNSALKSELSGSGSGGFLAAEKEKQATMSTFDRQIDSFFNRDTSNRDNSELLDIYVHYFKFTRAEYPSNQQISLKVLEKCTLHLKDDESLKNDVRFVKLWIEYADMVPTPNDVFSFMNSNKIGSQIALFWIAWAFIFEKIGNYKATDTVFQKGLSRKNLDNKELLASRYKQFQRRLARIMINSSNEGTLGETTASMAAAASVTLNLSQPEYSQPHGARQGLGGGFGGMGFSQQINAASSNSSSNNSNNAAPFRGNAPQAKTSSSSSSSFSSSQKGTSMASKANFSIFDENSSQAPSLSVAGNSTRSVVTENPHWKSLGTQNSLRKENEGVISKWNSGPLPMGLPTSTFETDRLMASSLASNPNLMRSVDNTSTLFSSSISSSTGGFFNANPLQQQQQQQRFQPQPAFQIFVEESSSTSNGAGDASANSHRDKHARHDSMDFDSGSNSAASSNQGLGLGLSVRPVGLATDTAGGERYEVERIAHDPVGRHKISASSTSSSSSSMEIATKPHLTSNSSKSSFQPLQPPATSYSSQHFHSQQQQQQQQQHYSNNEDDILMSALSEIGACDQDDTTINTKIAKRNIDELFCNYSPDSSKSHQPPSSSVVKVNPQSMMSGSRYQSSGRAAAGGQAGGGVGTHNGFSSSTSGGGGMMRGFDHSVVTSKTMVQSKFDALMRDDGVDVSIIEKQNHSMQFINTPFQKPQGGGGGGRASKGGNTQFSIFCDME